MSLIEDDHLVNLLQLYNRGLKNAEKVNGDRKDPTPTP